MKKKQRNALITSLCIIGMLFICTSALVIFFSGFYSTKKESVKDMAEVVVVQTPAINEEESVVDKSRTEIENNVKQEQITQEMSVKMKSVFNQSTDFLALCSKNMQKNKNDQFRWDSVTATNMVLYNLYFQSNKFQDGEKYSIVKKIASEGIHHLFGSSVRFQLKNSKNKKKSLFKLKNNSIYYNGKDTDNTEEMEAVIEIENIFQVDENTFEVVVESGYDYIREDSIQKGSRSKFLIAVDQEDKSKYGYIITSIKFTE